MSGEMTRWADRAAALYDGSYARKYRRHDDEIHAVEAYQAFCTCLTDVCDSFGRRIDVLDLGCGTGRYFVALRNVESLVGIDASADMLAEAAHPVGGDAIDAASIQLIRGDLLTHWFEPASFDLIYSIGVLAEHTPLNEVVADNIHCWLRPGGRFAFTTVHPDSPSIPRTLRRTAGRMLMRWIEELHAEVQYEQQYGSFAAVGGVKRRLQERLRSDGLYADEALIRGLLVPRFCIESLERIVSEAHLHCLCVARNISV